MNSTIKYPPELTQIVEYLSEPDTAIQFFRETHIADVTDIQSIHRYVRTDGRQGLVMNVTERGVSENSQILSTSNMHSPAAISAARSSMARKV
jgi:hypothetical protein